MPAGLTPDHFLRATLELPLPLEVVFPFFAAAENLEQVTPTELHFRILTPLPMEMHRGALVQYRLSLYGVPFQWLTEIAAWDPPHGFIDEQIRGPYGLWVHTHTFAATQTGTVIGDHVRYRLPLWPAGEVAYPLVRRELERIFAYRQRAMAAALLARTGSVGLANPPNQTGPTG